MIPLEEAIKIIPDEGKVAIGDTKLDYILLDAIKELQNLGKNVIAVPLFTYQLQYCKEKEIDFKVTYNSDYLITDINYFDEISFVKTSFHSVISEKLYFMRNPNVIGIQNSNERIFSIECLNQYLSFTKSYIRVYCDILNSRNSYLGFTILDVKPISDKIILEDLSDILKKLPTIIECSVFEVSPYRVFKIKENKIIEIK
jgi:hypothetical protein